MKIPAGDDLNQQNEIGINAFISVLIGFFVHGQKKQLQRFQHKLDRELSTQKDDIFRELTFQIMPSSKSPCRGHSLDGSSAWKLEVLFQVKDFIIENLRINSAKLMKAEKKMVILLLLTYKIYPLLFKQNQYMSQKQKIP